MGRSAAAARVLQRSQEFIVPQSGNVTGVIGAARGTTIDMIVLLVVLWPMLLLALLLLAEHLEAGMVPAAPSDPTP